MRRKSGPGSHDDWATPVWFKNLLISEFGDFFDPCPLFHDFPLNVDGLTIDWEAVNFMNPPYNQKDKEAFIMKAIVEFKDRGKTSLILIPASMETAIFQDHLDPIAETRLIKGRLQFEGINSKGVYVTNNSGQTGSMLCILEEGRQPDIITWDISKWRRLYDKREGVEASGPQSKG